MAIPCYLAVSRLDNEESYHQSHNRYSNGCGYGENEAHGPPLPSSAVGIGQRSYSYTQTSALEHLVKQDGAKRGNLHRL